MEKMLAVKPLEGKKWSPIVAANSIPA